MRSTILNKDCKVRGFTLLEMSMVILIASILIGGSLALFDQINKDDKFKETNRRMDVIEKAMTAYLRLTLRIPCPALNTASFYSSSSFGVSQIGTANTGTCNTTLRPDPTNAPTLVEGTVPTRTLGIPDMYAFDAWGNRFKYGMNTNCAGSYSSYWTEIATSTTSVPDANSLDTTRTNNLNLATGTVSANPALTNCANSGNYTIKSSGSAVNIATNIPFVLISYGPNGHGAWNAQGTVQKVDSELGANISIDEQTNSRYTSGGFLYATGTTVIFTAPNYVRSTSYFDDIVRFRSREYLLQNAGLILANPDPAELSKLDPVCDFATQVVTNDPAGTITNNAAAICGTLNTNCTTYLRSIANAASHLCLRYKSGEGA